MKRIFSVLLAALFILSAVACGAAPQSSSTAGSSTAGSSTEDKLKVAYIGLLGDNSFYDAGWAGLEKAKADFGVDIVSIEPATAADYGSSIVSAVNSGADMVLIFGGAYADTFNEYCERFPDVYFGGLNSVSANAFDNLVMASSGDHEGSFLAGALAAMVSKTGTIGATGGMEADNINRFLIGYEEGAKYVNPNIKVLKSYIGAYDDPATAKEFALQLQKEGADIIYTVAGGSNMGVFEAVKETEGLYAIGVDADQDGIVPGKILTSMVKRADNIAYDFVEMMVKNEFKSGLSVYGVADGGVSLTEFAHSKDMVTADMIKKLDDIKAKIIAGEIKVTDLFAK